MRKGFHHTMEKVTQILFLLLSTQLMMIEPAKILVIPFNIYSHINLFGILGKSLRDEGHEVWMLAADKYDSHIKSKGIIPLTFQLKPENDLLAQVDKWTAESKDGSGVVERWIADPWWIMALGRVCDDVMQDERLTTTIREQKFDLVVMDGTDEIACHLMVPYKYDIPFVTVHGFQTTSWVSGVTGMPSIEPEVGKPLSNRMNFWERLENLHMWMDRYNNFFYDLYKDHMERYCPPNKPKISLLELAQKSEMYLMNYEVMCLDYPRVSAPNMQFLGATSAAAPKPLPDDLQAFIAGAEHGVVLMSLGSLKAASQVWQAIGEKFFAAFARLPQRVVVQYRIDTVYGQVPPNVKLVKWLPQNDILGHKNVKLFINHGGNNGQNEAIYHGVPMLVVPVYMDQMYNAKRIEANGYGRYIPDKTTITSDEIHTMITEILANKTYAENAQKCSQIIRSMPTAQEKFVFWVNHILKFGGAHLRPVSLDMPLYQVLMLDIVAYYTIYYLVIFHVVLFLLYFAVKFIRNYFTKVKIE